MVLIYDQLKDIHKDDVMNLLFFLKQIDAMLPRVCAITTHRRRENVLRTSVTRTIGYVSRVPLVLTSDVICNQ